VLAGWNDLYVNEQDFWSIARGAAEPPSPPVEISVGNASLLLDRGDVRYYSVGGQELVRRVYVAVRNETWETPAAVVSPLEICEQPDGGIRATYEASVEDGDVCFAWAGVIALGAAGDLTYSMTGTAGSSFDYARIGLNILHPPSLEGRGYRAVTADGVLEGVVPAGIGPQMFADGEFFPLLPTFRTLEVSLEGTVEVHFEFTGDEFEIEDQRNWLDASYKTYSTPMSLGLLHAELGQSLAQEVRVRAVAPTLPPVPAKAAGKRGLTLQFAEAFPGGVYPAIGLGLPSGAKGLHPEERHLLAELGLGHLRTDVRLSSDSAVDAVAGAGAAALACGCGLELAVFLDAASPTELTRLRAAVEALEAPIHRLLAFSEHELVTSPTVVAAVREAVAPGVPVFGGTNLYFADLNRDRPDPSSADGFTFSANPQVHSGDDRSLTETPQSFADMLATARGFLGVRPIVVSPITLLARFNADAPGAGSFGPGAPPPGDHRQASLLCATFAALAVKFLAEGGAVAATFFETSGEGGVLARSSEAGSAGAGRALGSLEVPPGAAFPVLGVLSVCSKWAGNATVGVRSSDPLSVDAAACRIGGRLQVLVANATAADQPARLDGLASLGATSGRLAMMEAASVSAGWAAGRSAGGFADVGEVDAGRIAIELGPYAVALVDLQTS
jgi:hypothetical protein